MLTRFLDRTAGVNSRNSQFSDISGHWAEQYIKLAYEMNWVDGYEDKTFKPNLPITRAEVSKLINRALNRQVNASGILQSLIVKYTDLDSSHWAYYEIMEASISHTYQRSVTFSYNSMEKWTGRGIDIDYGKN